MKYEFSPTKLEKYYRDERYLKKKYGPKIADGMKMFLTILEAVDNAYDLKINPFLFMEHKKWNLSDYFQFV